VDYRSGFMRPTRLGAALLTFSLFQAGETAHSQASAVPPNGNASVVTAAPQMETPTLQSLGMHWVIGGDDNANAALKTAWRTKGGDWKDAAPLFRVEKGAYSLEIMVSGVVRYWTTVLMM